MRGKSFPRSTRTCTSVFGYWLGRRVARLLYRVRIGYVDSAGLERIDPSATVVCVMNHRSNMDYVLAGFLAADQAALSYAVGEWARIWPLSALIRAMGAYFVRRNSRDELYRRVLERYVAMATEAGVPQAVFPEGGLTRDGRMREPKLGVIDYMLRGFRIGGDRDLVFVPLGINYDRVLEDRSLLKERGSTGRAKGLWITFRFVLHNLSLMLRSEWHRFGYACVNFGTPISMREYCRVRGIDFQALAGEQRRAAISTSAASSWRRSGASCRWCRCRCSRSSSSRTRSALSEFELKPRSGSSSRVSRRQARTRTSRAASITR